MTIQEAAFQILEEMGKPISSKEIAKIALNRHMVSSSAQDPIQSHAQTIEKNIRDGIYNNPKLVFLNTPQGRLVGLASWNSSGDSVTNITSVQDLRELKVYIPAELFEQIKLAEQAKLKTDFNTTVAFILTKGVTVLSTEIKERLMAQLNTLDSLI